MNHPDNFPTAWLSWVNMTGLGAPTLGGLGHRTWPGLGRRYSVA